jgi:hypothetical protein
VLGAAACTLACAPMSGRQATGPCHCMLHTSPLLLLLQLQQQLTAAAPASTVCLRGVRTHMACRHGCAALGQQLCWWPQLLPTVLLLQHLLNPAMLTAVFIAAGTLYWHIRCYTACTWPAVQPVHKPQQPCMTPPCLSRCCDGIFSWEGDAALTDAPQSPQAPTLLQLFSLKVAALNQRILTSPQVADQAELTVDLLTSDAFNVNDPLLAVHLGHLTLAAL